MVYVYAVHLAGGSRHEHIASVRWKNPDDGDSGTSRRAEMVRWINGGGHAHMARIGVVNANPPYIRTYADNV